MFRLVMSKAAALGPSLISWFGPVAKGEQWDAKSVPLFPSPIFGFQSLLSLCDEPFASSASRFSLSLPPPQWQTNAAAEKERIGA